LFDGSTNKLKNDPDKDSPDETNGWKLGDLATQRSMKFIVEGVRGRVWDSFPRHTTQ
jgi:hypothetical protein